ncbi:bifunctional DNA primase/polymerase [Mycobacteroides abscessus]|uniref:bifunctional DNA primase/polymerase n=4 Tax=Mycobacteroides abscessus TaxID=36809 RepID=UPI0003AA15DB|nr:bifunctional DNA primase/polymerase [Mycobacteroides abscessus]MBE5456048.1 hypothetical protein [Mycobacteroides abscessus]MBN7463267.1 bifunctional DNA primase/polymerase [Mycobacteroides abscessus subsp. abscessus]MBN7557669.1 bifunctional DNA primase/polymerase [Mycobacteroides abscessus subsp. abscessus]MDM2407491.1 bifunctional DNA primase/polymerase [Mycobacteroides abscessus]MDM2414956.1 bifunctional DNA primase/polymerase [Mycobacteroides abscessus]
MIGTGATATDPLASVLASRNAGDTSDLAGYIGHLIKAGVEVVLVEPNGKTPLDFRTEAMKRADTKAGAHLRGDGTPKAGWYSGTQNASRAKTLLERAAEQGIAPNLGMHIGGSRYILVDCDNSGDVTAAQSLWVSHGDTLPPVTVRTPGQLDGDGRMEHDGQAGHLWLRLPEGVDPTTLRSYSEPLSSEAKEAQGRGGFAVMAGVGKGALLPPSVRAEGPYVYTDAPITVAPVWLIELLTKPVRADGERDSEDTRTAAVAAWEDSISWAALLEPRGWTATGNTESCGCPTWTRPGKNTHGAKSAVAHEPACDALGESTKRGALHLYTDAGPGELGGERTWSKLAFVAAMEGVSIPDAKAQLGIADTAPEVEQLVLGAELGKRLGEKLAAKKTHLTVVPDAESVASTDSAVEKNPFGVAPLHPSQLPAIEGDFWDRSPILQWIAKDAENEGVSAWAQLGVALAHVSTYVPHHVVLPTASGGSPRTLGEGGSLNFACILVGESGAGKSQILRHMQAVLPPDCLVVGAGTGQGWVKKYVHTETETDPQTKQKMKVRVRDRYAMLVAAPEIDGFMADFYRAGSKTGSVLRELLSGDATSNVTAEAEREATLKAGSYRFAVTMGAQPSHMASMFTPAEISGGTPQRFPLLPVSADLRPRTVPSSVPSPSMPLFPSAGPAFVAPSDGDDGEVLPAPHVIAWPTAARTYMAQIRAERDALAARGYVPTLGMSPEEREEHTARTIQNHTVLTRLRVMALLAILHGRSEPTDEDWEAAGVFVRIHLGMLAAVWAELKESGDADARETGRRNGIAYAAADASKADATAGAVERVATRLRKHLIAHGPTAGAALRRVLASRDRHLFRPALQELTDTGQLAFDGTTYSTVVTFQTA